MTACSGSGDIDNDNWMSKVGHQHHDAPAYRSVSRSVSVCLSVCLSVSLSFCLAVCLSVCLSV